MFKRNNVHRTPKQKAEKASLNVLARLAGCALLVYYVVKLLTADDAPITPVTIVIGIVFVVAAAVVIVINFIDFFRGWKEGRYKTATYEENDLAEYLEAREAESADTVSENEKQEPDVHPDDDEQLNASEQDDTQA